MASIFETLFSHAGDTLKNRLMVAATITYAADQTTAAIQVAFQEQVGFVDDKLRAVFFYMAADLTVAARRGDVVVIDGQTQQWVTINVRDDKAGGIELRCDAYMERL